MKTGYCTTRRPVNCKLLVHGHGIRGVAHGSLVSCSAPFWAPFHLSHRPFFRWLTGLNSGNGHGTICVAEHPRPRGKETFPGQCAAHEVTTPFRFACRTGDNPKVGCRDPRTSCTCTTETDSHHERTCPFDHHYFRRSPRYLWPYSIVAPPLAFVFPGLLLTRTAICAAWLLDPSTCRLHATVQIFPTSLLTSPHHKGSDHRGEATSVSILAWA